MGNRHHAVAGRPTGPALGQQPGITGRARGGAQDDDVIARPHAPSPGATIAEKGPPLLMRIERRPGPERGRIELIRLNAIDEIGLRGQVEVQLPDAQCVEHALVAGVVARLEDALGHAKGQLPRQQELAGFNRLHGKAMAFHHRVGQSERPPFAVDSRARGQAPGRNRHIVPGHGQPGYFAKGKNGVHNSSLGWGMPWRSAV